jgi:cytidylate kinase
MSQRKVITIDGPAGAGKGSTAELLSQTLNCKQVSIGDIYRTTTFLCLKNKVDFQDTEKIKSLIATITPELIKENFTEIKKEEIGQATATGLTYNKDAKLAVIDYYKNLYPEDEYIIYEGREAGNLAFPDAYLKLFITASPEIRAKRALKRDAENNLPCIPLEDKIAQVKKRDEVDIDPKKIGLMVKAKGATEIVTDNHSVQDTVDEIIHLLEQI